MWWVITVIDIQGNIAKQRTRAMMLRKLSSIERSLARDMSPKINAQFMAAAKMIDKGVVDTAADMANNNRGQRREILQKNYIRVASLFAEDIITQAQQKSIMPGEVKGMMDEFWQAFQRWAQTVAAMKVVRVDTTTKKVIAAIISKGMSEGLSNYEIAKKVRKVGNITKMRRARTIARTETHNAMGSSIQQAAAVTRVLQEKEWSSALDERTRRSHVAADGQRVPIDGKFIVDGEALDHPGDPNGSAGNIINCRCVALYHSRRVEEVAM
jgi:uncharacterized protein with gpF-like domain